MKTKYTVIKSLQRICVQRAEKPTKTVQWTDSQRFILELAHTDHKEDYAYYI